MRQFFKILKILSICLDDLAKHYENYDLTNLNYDLVKEYSHLKIDKNEEFMKRMLFDIFKRQTKGERLEKILEKNKVKLNENDRIKTFNRLIEDANRRIEAQEKIDDLKAKLQKGNEDEKNYSSKEWEEIYQQRQGFIFNGFIISNSKIIFYLRNFSNF